MIGPWLASAVDEVARAAKVLYGHQDCDGWSWPYPSDRLFCGCGALLVDVKAAAQ